MLIIIKSRDKDIQEATTQWYTLYPLAERWNLSADVNQPKYIRDLNEVKSLGFTEYSEMIELGQSMAYGNRTIHDSKLQKMRLDPNVDFKDVESVIQEKLGEGYREYGVPFLINYAMPMQTETTIGIYNHTPMPISLKGTGRLKRVVKHMLDQMNATTNKVEKLELKEAIQLITDRYSAFRNYFDGKFDALPTGDAEMMSRLNNPPGFSDNLRTVFDRYEKLQIQEGKFSQDVFGMGSKYDNNVMFYRRLIAEGLGNKENLALKEATSILSSTNQLLMENNYMDPISYYLNVKNVRATLEKLGLDKAQTMGVDGGELSPLKIHSKENQLAVLTGDKGGISVRPMQMMTDYNLSLIRKYIKQGREMKETQSTSKEWSEHKLEYEKSGWCKP